jgi:hypothetical protein
VLAQLHSKARNTARTALNQDGLARFQVRGVVDRRKCRQAGEPQRSCFGMAQAMTIFSAYAPSTPWSVTPNTSSPTANSVTRSQVY